MNGVDIDKSFEADCIAMVREIETYASEQQKVWEEVADIIIDGEDVSIQIELISDMKAHKLFKAKEKAATLALAIADSAKVAKTSSVRVKEIDKLKERVNSTLELASGISKQRNSLEGIGAALEKNDYETAADFVESYYEIEAQLYEVARLEEDHESDEDEDADDAVSHGTASDNSSIVDVKPQGTKTTARLLEKKRDAVRSAIRREFNNAASNRDRDQVIRFSKLFKKVGLEKEGREQYSRWVQQGAGAQLKKHVEDRLAQLRSGNPQNSHLQLISMVLDHIFRCIETEQAHVVENYGPQGLHTMVKALHEECSRHSVEILKAFFDQYKEDESGSIGAGMDSREMDKIISEISQLSHLTNVYYRYLRDRCDFKEGDPALSMSLSDFCKSTHLGPPDMFEKLQHLLNCYPSLQTDYLITTYNYALESNLGAGTKQQSDQKTPSGRASGAQSPIPSEPWNRMINPVSNILANFTNEDDENVDLDAGVTITEDVFFTLANAAESAVCTNDERIIREVVSRMNHEILQQRLLHTVSENMSFKKENYVTKRTLSWMNACRTSATYTEQLAEKLIGLIKGSTLCEQPADNSAEVVVDVKYSVMADEVSNTALQFQELLETATQKSVLIITKQMIEKGFKQFESLSYVLGEAKLMNYEINDPWLMAAVSSWDLVLSTYSSVLNTENYDALLLELVTWATKKMEEMIMSKAFDLYGGLQIDRDIRNLKQYFSAKTEKPVREKFTRLSHIANLLVVEKLSEAEDLWSGAVMIWRLTPAETQKVLSLRKDLPREGIRTLNLARTRGNES